MSGLVKLQTYETACASFEIHVGTDGYFYADMDGENMRFDSLQKLKDAIDKATKLIVKNVSIPLHRLYSNELKRVVITGIHTGHSAILYREVFGNELGRPQHESHYSAKSAFYRMTDEDVATFAELSQAASQAQEARQKFIESKRERDPWKLVLDARKSADAASLASGGSQERT